MIGSPFRVHNSRRSGGEHRADVEQVLAAPEELAIDYKARHPKDAVRLGGMADPLQLRPPLSRHVSREAYGVGTCLFEHRPDHAGVLDVELALPKTLEDQVMIAPQHLGSLALDVEHADRGKG